MREIKHTYNYYYTPYQCSVFFMPRAANIPLGTPDAQVSVFKYSTSDAKPDGKTGVPVEIVVYCESTPLDMHLSTTAPPLNFDFVSLRTVQSLSEYRTVP